MTEEAAVCRSATGKHTKRRRLVWLAVLVILVGAGIAVAYNWNTLYWRLQYNVPLRYDQPFGRMSANADRIVVTNASYRWDTTVLGDGQVLFQITNPAEVKEVASHFQFQPIPTKDSAGDSYSNFPAWPTICWYSGNKRIAATGVLDYDTIRWSGFTTRRFFGFPVYFGDGPLTAESQKWLRKWLTSHSVPRSPYDLPRSLYRDSSGRVRLYPEAGD